MPGFLPWMAVAGAAPLDPALLGRAIAVYVAQQEQIVVVQDVLDEVRDTLDLDDDAVVPLVQCGSRPTPWAGSAMVRAGRAIPGRRILGAACPELIGEDRSRCLAAFDQ